MAVLQTLSAAQTQTAPKGPMVAASETVTTAGTATTTAASRTLTATGSASVKAAFGRTPTYVCPVTVGQMPTAERLDIAARASEAVATTPGSNSMHVTPATMIASMTRTATVTIQMATARIAQRSRIGSVSSVSVRASSALIVVAVWSSGCVVEQPSDISRYLHDASYRRDQLQESLVNPRNTYSQRRLTRYQTWNELPEWNPPVSPLLASGVTDAFAPVFSERARWTLESLTELGGEAFHRYPVQLDDAVELATTELPLAERYGMWRTSDGRLGGLVHVETPGNGTKVALTCSTCHARIEDGVLVDGATNSAFDWGGLIHETQRRRLGGAPGELLDWGPGRVDVTSDAISNAAAIVDLRPVRYQNHLHSAGTVKNSIVALALRIETLLITSNAEATRPPREVALGLALYLWSLGAKSIAADEPPPDPRGQSLFAESCAGCHHRDGTTSDPVPIEEVGTDPLVGLSPERTTGFYRIPSLWAVADRTPLLHDGSIATLESLFNPDRLTTVQGHEFGLDLTADDRHTLISYIKTIGTQRD